MIVLLRLPPDSLSPSLITLVLPTLHAFPRNAQTYLSRFARTMGSSGGFQWIENGDCTPLYVARRPFSGARLPASVPVSSWFVGLSRAQ